MQEEPIDGAVASFLKGVQAKSGDEGGYVPVRLWLKGKDTASTKVVASAEEVAMTQLSPESRTRLEERLRREPHNEILRIFLEEQSPVA